MTVGVAQLVEQRDHNPQVVGSSPTPDTIFKECPLKIYNFMYNGCIEDSLFLRRKKRIFEKFKSMRL